MVLLKWVYISRGVSQTHSTSRQTNDSLLFYGKWTVSLLLCLLCVTAHPLDTLGYKLVTKSKHRNRPWSPDTQFADAFYQSRASYRCTGRWLGCEVFQSRVRYIHSSKLVNSAETSTGNKYITFQVGLGEFPEDNNKGEKNRALPGSHPQVTSIWRQVRWPEENQNPESPTCRCNMSVSHCLTTSVLFACICILATYMDISAFVKVVKVTSTLQLMDNYVKWLIVLCEANAWQVPLIMEDFSMFILEDMHPVFSAAGTGRTQAAQFSNDPNTKTDAWPVLHFVHIPLDAFRDSSIMLMLQLHWRSIQ